jgi:hypothetical protein
MLTTAAKIDNNVIAISLTFPIHRPVLYILPVGGHAPKEKKNASNRILSLVWD